MKLFTNKKRENKITESFNADNVLSIEDLALVRGGTGEDDPGGYIKE